MKLFKQWKRSIFLACLIVVLLQSFMGTKKFFSYPRSTILYSKQADPPVLIICQSSKQLFYDLAQFNLDYDQYVTNGKCSNGISTVEEIYEKATNGFYYFLDKSGNNILPTIIELDTF